MTMTWDAPLVAAVASELDRSLRGERLRAVHLDHPGACALLWFQDTTLAFRLGSAEGYVTLGDAGTPLEEAHTLAAAVERVEAPPDDRVLLIRMRRPRGHREPVLVIAELMTNQWNVVVTRGEDRTIRHVLREREGGRALRVGSPWCPPPASDREGRDGDLSRARWHELLGGVEPKRRRRTLLSSVAWTSSINAGALLGNAVGVGPKDTRAALDRGYDLWRRIHASVSEPDPAVLRQPEGFQAYPLPLPGLEAESVASLLEGIGQARESTGPVIPAELPTSWVQAVHDRARGARAKVRSLERELENAPDPAEARAIGDLLLARFGEVPRGRTQVVLESFSGEDVVIELDPSLEPHENANRWYDRAARAERARERLPRLIESARAEVRKAEALLERVAGGDVDTAELRETFPSQGVTNLDPGGPRLPYRRFRSSGGLEIRVGRGARHNDDLTFHHSDPNDIWLHARHVGGAHVVLRWKGDGSPPARDLAEAATLAALHSNARTSASVPVDWARRKHVRKPRNAPPGRVLVEREKTVFVEPDARVAERLTEE
jgi:hypothetical protein